MATENYGFNIPEFERGGEIHGQVTGIFQDD